MDVSSEGSGSELSMAGRNFGTSVREAKKCNAPSGGRRALPFAVRAARGYALGFRWSGGVACLEVWPDPEPTHPLPEFAWPLLSLLGVVR